MPLHPDTKLFKMKNIKPNIYYPQLCEFFQRVENQYCMPIVIAAHPKAVEYKEKKFFEGREILFNRTAELCQNAHFVLAHDSTSVNYPIAFSKKIHFIASKNIKSGIIEYYKFCKLFRL